MIFRIIICVICVRDEIKRFSQRCADRMEERSNVLAINLVKEVKTTRRLERKLPRDSCTDRTVIYRAYATGHTFFETFINCQVYY